MLETISGNLRWLELAPFVPIPRSNVNPFIYNEQREHYLPWLGRRIGFELIMHCTCTTNPLWIWAGNSS